VVNVGKLQEGIQESENVVVGTRITKPMYAALVKLLTLDSHVTISDYLRDVLRRDLEQKGFLKTEAPAV
jgi:hypothetical protein